MSTIEVEGVKYKVLDSLGFVHDVGAYVKQVQTPDGPKMVIKAGKNWRFWTAQDRVAPLIEAAQKGWPKPGWSL